MSKETVAQFNELQKQKKAVLAEIKKLKKQQKNIVEEYFSEVAKEQLFDKFPKLEKFSWNQGTPSWNDGDTCYFSANVDGPEVNDVYLDDVDDEVEDKELKELDEFGAAVVTFLHQFGEDELKDWFGDPVTVSVVRCKDDKIKVTTGDYDID